MVRGLGSFMLAGRNGLCSLLTSALPSPIAPSVLAAFGRLLAPSPII